MIRGKMGSNQEELGMRKRLDALEQERELCEERKIKLFKAVNKLKEELRDGLIDGQRFNDELAKLPESPAQIISGCNKEIESIEGNAAAVRKQLEKLVEKKRKERIAAAAVIALVVLLSVSALFLTSRLTGFVTREEVNVYTQQIAANFTREQQYVLNISSINVTGELRSLKLSGRLIGNGTAKVYMQNGNARLLALDTEALQERGASGIIAVTGRAIADVAGEDAVLEENATPGANESEANATLQLPKGQGELNVTLNETQVNETQANETADNEMAVNETQPAPELPLPDAPAAAEKAINISLAYKPGTIFDSNDDGIELETSAIDFTVEGANFTWQADASKLCTRWVTTSLDNGTQGTACYGSPECCSLLELVPAQPGWNDAFELFVGRYGAAYNNTVSSQVIFANYSLGPESVYSEIYYSSFSTLPATFVAAPPLEEGAANETNMTIAIVEFNSICVETCSLSGIAGLNLSAYALIVEVENATLVLDSATYTLANAVETDTEAPVVAITLPENMTYFEALPANDSRNATPLELNFTVSEPAAWIGYSLNGRDNVTITSNATIAAANGTNELIVYASDQSGNIGSGTVNFSVTFYRVTAEKTELLIQGMAEIGRPVKWTKKVMLGKAANATTQIHASARNITVRKGEKGGGSIESYVSVKKKGAVSRLGDFQKPKPDLAPAAAAEKKEPEENITLLIEEKAAEYEIEYETEAPTATEKEFGRNRKQVTVSSDIHYENITAYTTITESPAAAVELYWLKTMSQEGDKPSLSAKNSAREEVSDAIKQDTNSNGLTDRLEWTVPYLSNQTYEVVITTGRQPVVISSFTPSYELYVSEQTYIDKYMDWQFTPLGDSRWLANFSFTEPFQTDLNKCLSNRFDASCWAAFRNTYLPGENLARLAVDLSNLSYYPLRNLTAGLAFSNFSTSRTGNNIINITRGRGSFVIEAANLTEGISAKFGWNSTIINITTTTPFTSWQRAICRDGSGMIHVAWRFNTTSVAWANSSDNGTTWSVNDSFYSGSSANTRLNPHISCDGSNITVAYEDSTADDVTVGISTNNGTGWAWANPVTTGVTNEVSVERRGTRIYLVYVDVATNRTVRFINSTDGGATWGTQPGFPTISVAGTPDVARPTLAVDGNGSSSDKIYIAADVTDFNTWFVSSADSGKTWGDQVRVSGTSASPPQGRPSITYNGSDIYVAMTDGTTPPGIKFANSTDGISWRNYTIDDNGNISYFPSITTDQFGYPWVFWEQNVSDGVRDIVYRKFNGTDWEPAKNVTFSAGDPKTNNTLVSTKIAFNSGRIDFVYRTGNESGPFNITYGFIDLAPIAGTLNVTLTGGSANITQNGTFSVNASVSCQNADCQQVNATPYFNWTGPISAPLNDTELAIPFFNISGFQNQTCSGLLSQGQDCSVNWTINATGPTGSNWLFTINFTSNIAGAIPNGTSKFSVNLSAAAGPSNTLPIVFNSSVALNSSVTLTDGGRTELTVKFNATDADGVANLNNAAAGVNITLNGIKRSNNSGNCEVVGDSDANTRAYSCIVVFSYFDNSSSIWEINLSAADSSGAVAYNDSNPGRGGGAANNLTVNSLSAFSIVSSSIAATTSTGIQNVEMTFTINNTGNFDFTLINVTPTDLNASLTDFFKLEGNFSINATASTSDGFGRGIFNATPTNFSDSLLGGQLSATLPHKTTLLGGQGSVEGDTKANRTLYIYIDIPQNKGLSTGVTYNVSPSQPWQVILGTPS